MTLTGRENDVSGNGVTLDYDMLLKVLRQASNDTRESLRIMVDNLDWHDTPSALDARRMRCKADNLAEITETLWVLQSMDADQDGEWPEKRWPREPENGNLVGFQWTRRKFLHQLMEEIRVAREEDGLDIIASPPCEAASQQVKHCSTCGEEGHNMRTCTATMQEHANNGFSAWNEYQTDSENHIFWKSGPRKGKMNQKAMAKAYRKQSEDELITCKECGTDETSIDKRTNRPLWRHKKASFGPLCNACGSRRYRNQS